MKATLSFITLAVGFTITTVSAQAFPPITGEIDFSGGVTVDSAVPGATSFSSFFGPSGPSSGPVVQAGLGLPSGSYMPVPGNTAANYFAPFNFANYYSAYQASTTLPSFELWSFSYGPELYSFDVNSVTSVSQFSAGGTSFINIGGMGTGYIYGASTNAPTPEVWSITATTSVSGATTLTLNSSFTAVPEPSTLAFGGLGSLLSLAVFCRRK